MNLGFTLYQPVSSLATHALDMPEQQCSLLHDVNCIRSLIMTAKEQELVDGKLERLLSQLIPNLHPSIQLPEYGAVDSLAEFITAYIENVPNFFEAILNAAFEAGLETAVVPPLKVAMDFFLTPPSEVFDHCGLEELLDQALFAHRLFEDLNDYYRLKAGISIIYVDMTTANLIAHNIIGEEFANKLEKAVENATQKLLDNEHLFETEQFQQHLSKREELWDNPWQHWSELFSVKKINLNLSYRSS